MEEMERKMKGLRVKERIPLVWVQAPELSFHSFLPLQIISSFHHFLFFISLLFLSFPLSSIIEVLSTFHFGWKASYCKLINGLEVKVLFQNNHCYSSLPLEKCERESRSERESKRVRVKVGELERKDEWVNHWRKGRRGKGESFSNLKLYQRFSLSNTRFVPHSQNYSQTILSPGWRTFS